MRVIAIDYGRQRIGIAMTDITKTIAYPFKIVLAKNTIEETIDEILNVLKIYIPETEKIIIGLPIKLDNTESKMTLEVKKFAEVFKTKTNISIEFIDERLSSKMVERDLKENLKLNRKKRSKIVDPIAATILLQNYIGI